MNYPSRHCQSPTVIEPALFESNSNRKSTFEQQKDSREVFVKMVSYATNAIKNKVSC